MKIEVAPISRARIMAWEFVLSVYFICFVRRIIAEKRHWVGRDSYPIPSGVVADPEDALRMRTVEHRAGGEITDEITRNTQCFTCHQWYYNVGARDHKGQ